VDLPVDFKDLLEEFALSRVEAVLVGGYAVAFHGRPRATKDLDLVLSGSEGNLQRAADALDRFGAPPIVVRSVASMGPTEVVFMGAPPLRIDLLRTFARALDVELDGVRLRVIALNDLIANKEAAGRPQDLNDAQFLRRVRAASVAEKE
jgi:hypothetical protein